MRFRFSKKMAGLAAALLIGAGIPVAGAASQALAFTCPSGTDCWFQFNNYTGEVNLTSIFNNWETIPTCFDCTYVDQSVSNNTNHDLWLKNTNGNYFCLLPHSRTSLAPPVNLWQRYYQTSIRTNCSEAHP